MPSVLDIIGARAARTGLSLDDTRALWATTDVVGIGMLADEARRRRHGDRTTYVRVARVPFADAATAALPPSAGEVRVTGEPPPCGLAADSLAPLVQRAGGVPVTAFSLADLEGLTGGGVALTEYLRCLADAGVSAVAEAPLDRLPEPRRALEALANARLPAARFTIERPPGGDPSEFLHAVRQLQKATGLMRGFAPLSRHIVPTAPTTGYDDVKLVALARLVLDNVPSIQVDWSLYGPKLAQVALLFGADDVDGVSAVDEAAEGRRRAPLEEIRRNITAASLVPVERDGRFAVRA